MEIFNIQTIVIFEIVIFVTIVIMNLIRKNSTLISLYIFQSLALVGLLVLHAIEKASLTSFLIALIIFVIKVIIAPRLFQIFIEKNKFNLSSSSYLTVPITLILLLALMFLSQSDVLKPLSLLVNQATGIRMMIMSSVFMSLFLIINRKGALSQIIGVLALENSIVALGFFIGSKQTFSLELGILVDVLVWIIIASIFVKFIYKHFGSSDVSKLNQLRK